MSVIVHVQARQILDSRGNPTLEVDVRASDGFGRAAVPSGASTGEHEAVELRDNDPNTFLGKGVRRAVNHVNTEIRQAIKGLDVRSQVDIDQTLIDLDGTPQQKSTGSQRVAGCFSGSRQGRRSRNGSAPLPLYRWH